MADSGLLYRVSTPASHHAMGPVTARIAQGWAHAEWQNGLSERKNSFSAEETIACVKNTQKEKRAGHALVTLSHEHAHIQGGGRRSSEHAFR